MKKGFTLVEIMVVIGIISICSVVFSMGINRSDKLELRDTEIKIINMLETVVERSYEEGTKYKILIDYDSKKIEVYTLNKDKLIEKIKMSDKLYYEGTYLDRKVELETTETGNFSGGGYSIYLFSKEKNNIYSKITIFTGTAGLKYAFISHYKANEKITIKNYKKIESKEWEQVN